MTVNKANSKAKVFQISSESADDHLPGAEPITILLPGDDYEITLQPPSSTSFVLMTATLRAGSSAEMMADIINGFFSLIDDEREASLVRGRLFDPHDPLNGNGITDAFSYALEEWSGRPTSAPGPSVSSRSRSGKSSQANRRSAE